MSLRLLSVALALPLVVAGMLIVAFRGGDERVAVRPRTALFDGHAAFSELRTEVALGPRPAGSPVSRRLAERLRRELPRGHFEEIGPTHPGLRNIVGVLPGRKPAILVGAHYDTKDLPGFVGANDGAGGTAVVLELARVLARNRHGPELRFVLFDGEESPRGTPDSRFALRGLRGSKAYARRHASELRAMILVDFVAQRGLSLPREAGSDPALWGRLRASARRVGVGAAFPATENSEIYDDHTPFARLGVPSIDLIDFDFPCFHRPCDDLGAVSERSLDTAGEALAQLLRSYTR